jgi:glycerophosphoryl diester phosphodiesterase
VTGVIQRNGHRALLTAHKALLSGKHHGNTIGGVAECAAAGVPRFEIDIHSIDDADYVVFHERRLEKETTAEGPIGRATVGQIKACRFLHDKHDRPPLLSEVVDAVVSSNTQVQLDLKDWRPMPEARIRTLLNAVAPIHDRVIVSTGQDWNLVRLHRADPELALGFDPGHYLDHGIEEQPMFLPRNIGAYGYRDDHPMAVGKTEDVRDYLHDRWTLLGLQAPWAKEFFLSYVLILQMLDDGFDVVAWLHEHSIAVTAWTPDYRNAKSLDVLDKLMAAGVDRITTNTIPAWEAAASG